MRVARLASLVVLSVLWLRSIDPASADTIALVVDGEPAKQPIVEAALEPWLKAKKLDVSIGVGDETISRKLLDCAAIREPAKCEEWLAKLTFDYTMYVMVDADLVAGTDKIDLTGWLFKGGKFVASQTQPCRECRNDTLGPTAEDLASALFAVQAQGTGRLAITSTPLGAKVSIDGQVVGATPWEQGLRDGTHKVTIEQAGFRPHTQSVEVKRDDLVAVDVVLVSEAGAGGGGGGGVKRNPLWLGVAGGGVVALIGGGVLFAMDEDPESIPDSQKTYTDSALGGGVLMGVGVAAIAAGAYLYFTTGKPTGTAPTAWLAPHGGVVGLAGAF
jgi:PEGA domain